MLFAVIVTVICSEDCLEETKFAKVGYYFLQIDVKEYIAQDKLGKLTVAALKEVCRNYNLKCTGKKVDLINTIEDYFKKQST